MGLPKLLRIAFSGPETRFLVSVHNQPLTAWMIDVEINGQRMPKAKFLSLLAQKGWRVADAAWRWNLSPEHLSRQIADPQRRDPRLDDAVIGLPRLTAAEASAIRRARLADRESRGQKVATKVPAGLRYQGQLTPHDEVATTDAVGSIPAGELGEVLQTRIHGDEEQYLLKFPQDEAWWRPDDIDRWIAPTGRTRS